MKVLHISTLDTGGAAVAAIRLHEGLRRLGVHSDVLVRSRHRDIAGVVKLCGDKPAFLQKVYRKTLNKFRPSRPAWPAHADFEKFSQAGTGIDITAHPLYGDADIVHLHWVANFLDYPTFFRKNKKPLVWTLHDMNPFMGGFHYRNDLIRNKEVMGREEESQFKIKEVSLSQAGSDLRIIAPSKWLMSESGKSKLLGQFRHACIANGVDTTLFRPYDRQLARDVFGFPADRPVFSFISERIDNYRKGFDLLTDAINDYQLAGQAVFAAVGKASGNSGFPGVFKLGPIHDERLMALLLSASDGFILPSREDNLPNVMLEAMACGTPVIGFAVGGIAETVQDGITGILAREISSAALGDAIQRFLRERRTFSREAVRNFAEQHFTLEFQARQYLKLYEELMAVR